MRVSVVIATLGGECLSGTVEKLNSSTVVPDEILICIPREFVKNVANFKYHNVLIVPTECKGQVAQRAIGFQFAKGDLVLQLDDDISLENGCLQHLIDELGQLPINSAVGPTFYYFGERRSSFYLDKRNFISSIYFRLLNPRMGYRQGIITRSAVPIGCYFVEGDEPCKKSEWLPGGCVLHRKENLVLYDFYPLKGKAFCEDLFHSSLLLEKGVNLFMCNKAKVFCEKPISLGFFENIKIMKRDYQARVLFLNSFPRNKSKINLILYYIINFPRHLFYFHK
jgi:glycosyltransferase involved in cell wall biosynthesis